MVYRKLLPERETTPRNMTVYLLHFDRPLAHARHYMGIATNVQQRLSQHRAGQGAKLIKAATAAGITFELARVWENMTLRDEYRLKNMGGLSRLCPFCQGCK